MSLDVEFGEHQQSFVETPTIEFLQIQLGGVELRLIQDYNPAEYLNPDIYRGLQAIANARKRNGDQVIESMFVRPTEQDDKPEYRYGLFVIEHDHDYTPNVVGGAAIRGATTRGFQINR